MGNEESRPVDDSVRPQTLQSRTLDALARYVASGKVKRVVVMSGAGISTSAGIPDFRSPETGLYANLARLDLPYAEAVFDISYFRRNPLPFYTLAQELYPGKYRPTITHSFIKLLHDKGLLLKHFTQNIDCLDREAGVPGEQIVEAHGSFARQSCIECKTNFPDGEMLQHVKEKKVPHCVRGGCNGLVKPEIVFFGEALPQEFFLARSLPMAADLVIVLGTSLTVQPFASLPTLVPEGVPRVLINLEQVGGIGSRPDDVLLLGDCDKGVCQLAKACGWLEDLVTLWESTGGKFEHHEEPCNELPKTKEEAVNDEVEKLTQDVDKTLKISQDHDKKVRADTGIVKRIARHLEGELPGTSSKDEPVPEGNDLSHVFPHINKKPSL